MKTIKTILVPIDGGEPSESALAYAVDVAEKFGARVVVMSSFELPIVGFPDGVLVATADLANRIIEDTQAFLLAAVKKHQARNVALETMLEQGNPKDTIVAAIAKSGADLVVMGTHGRKGLPRALLGSVAERIVRTSPIPVLTVHGPAHPTVASEAVPPRHADA